MERVLVVDDDRQVQKVLKRLFEFEGYEVVLCGDGGSALEAFRRTPPTAVVLDLGLPVIPGVEVCRRMREDSVTAAIIILSARVELLSKVLLLEVGADDYLTKPFSPRELLARVRAAIRHAPKFGFHNVITFDGVRVDFTSMDATFDNQSVALTLTEFKLLRFFVQNAECVVSRDEILRDACDYSNYTSSHVVNEHIFHLRRKLERDPANPVHFRTVHGVGYKFVP